MDIKECIFRFDRYLQYDAITSGSAVTATYDDYKDLFREKKFVVTLPTAYQELIEEENEALLKIIAERVENLCGFKPDSDTVAKFLKSLIKDDQKIEPPQSVPVQGQLAMPPFPSRIGFFLHGKYYNCRNAIGVMIQIFEVLSVRDALFVERFAAFPKRGNHPYLAKNPAELNP
ncbi:hypothetical protein CCP3SC1AL1_4150001 [Gammaproteobacteria bacterium]